jgi:hypothetical protein
LFKITVVDGLFSVPKLRLQVLKFRGELLSLVSSVAVEPAAPVHFVRHLKRRVKINSPRINLLTSWKEPLPSRPELSIRF